MLDQNAYYCWVHGGFLESLPNYRDQQIFDVFYPFSLKFSNTPGYYSDQSYEIGLVTRIQFDWIDWNSGIVL